MKIIQKLFLHSPIKYACIFIIGVLIVLLNLLSKGFTAPINYVDGLFIAGFALVLIGGMSLLNYYGAYDFWSYAFSRRKIDGKRLPISEFSEEKKNRRKLKPLPFGPYFGLGIIFLLTSLVLALIVL